jgi:alpha-N-acetylglucosaminidase
MKKYWILFIFLTPLAVMAGDFDGVAGIVKRRVPWLDGHIVFNKIENDALGKSAGQGEKNIGGDEGFILSSAGGKIVVSATGRNAAAEGLDWYLKYYCHRSMSHMGDNLAPVASVPMVKDPVTIRAVARYRHALNYCTYNYSMSFYTWKDWERELDWMALNGVNLMLVANGEEAVWQNVLRRFGGYSEKEILDFITGPAFNAWWLMGNIQGWGGPMPQTQIDGRVQMVQQMLARMKELGIEPVMPCFFGMVPSTLKDKSKAHVIVQGTWGAFTRPDILDPSDTLFSRLAGIFYEETKRLYGKDIHFFSGDPFHEGGITEGVDLGAAGQRIQRSMQDYFPGSVWVLQGWQANPRKEMLAGLDRSKVLVQELFGETTNNWEKRQAYEGTPFVWCMITNYGERPGLFGKLQRYADEPYRARHGEYSKYLAGVGIMPEGIDNNPVSYDLMLEVGWHEERMDVEDWIRQYTWYRYGRLDTSVVRAWTLLLQTVYSSPEGYQEGPPENVLCARPALKIKSVSTWGTLRKNYDTALFAQAVQLFDQAAGRLKGSETYRIDRINFLRQVLANRADIGFAKIVETYGARDSVAFKKAAAKFLTLHDQSDALLKEDPYYSLERYKRDALAAGQTPGEKKNNLLNALMLITYWGMNDRKEDNLHEYAYKEWSGMMKSFYKRRWEMYLNWLLKDLRGEKAEAPDFYGWERQWVRQQWR